MGGTGFVEVGRSLAIVTARLENRLAAPYRNKSGKNINLSYKDELLQSILDEYT